MNSVASWWQPGPRGLRIAFIMASLAGYLWGNLWYYVIRVRRKTVLQNLHRTFENRKTAQEIHTLARHCFIHWATCWLEIPLSFLINAKNYHSCISFEGTAEAMRYFQQKHGKVVTSCHLGNFELFGIMGRLWGELPQRNIVARRLQNPLLNRTMQRFMESVNFHLVFSKGSLSYLCQALSRHEVVVATTDQRMRRGRGVFIQFLKRPARVAIISAALASMLQKDPYYVYAVRSGFARHRFVFHGTVPLTRSLPPVDQVLQLTQQLSDVSSQLIEQYPEQWFWMHRLWKDTPQADDLNHDRATVQKLLHQLETNMLDSTRKEPLNP